MRLGSLFCLEGRMFYSHSNRASFFRSFAYWMYGKQTRLNQDFAFIPPVFLQIASFLHWKIFSLWCCNSDRVEKMSATTQKVSCCAAVSAWGGGDEVNSTNHHVHQPKRWMRLIWKQRSLGLMCCRADRLTLLASDGLLQHYQCMTNWLRGFLGNWALELNKKWTVVV